MMNSPANDTTNPNILSDVVRSCKKRADSTAAAEAVIAATRRSAGRKPVLALSLAGTSLGYALFAIGIVIKSIPLLFLARALARPMLSSGSTVSNWNCRSMTVRRA